MTMTLAAAPEAAREAAAASYLGSECERRVGAAMAAVDGWQYAALVAHHRHAATECVRRHTLWV